MEWVRINDAGTEYEFLIRDYDVYKREAVFTWKKIHQLKTWEKEQVLVKFINILKYFPVKDIQAIEQSISNIQLTVIDFIEQE